MDVPQEKNFRILGDKNAERSIQVKGTEPMKLYRSKFRRLLELDSQIRSGKFPNTFSFSKEWEVSRKTIVRDIEFLRDSLRAPIEYDAKQKGYRYTDTSWSIQQVELTEGELLQILVAERMAEQYKGTPLARTLETVFEKIRAILPDKVTIDPALLRAQVSFYGHYARPISEEIWLPLFRALRESRTIEFWYKAASWRKGHTREVEPVHLACIADEWYLVAFEPSLEEMRNFAVSRIQSIVKVSDETFKPHEFEPETYFENRFGRFVGKPGDIHKVSIRFDRDIAVWLPEREWHPKQKIQKHRDGSLTLTFPAPSLYEVQRWVLQWGSEAEVLEPKALREAVKKELIGMQEKYGRQV